jgi:arylformamidase
VSGWIDVSLPLSPELLTWPGNPPVEVVANQRIADGDAANVSELRLGTHSGTHVDPPVHFLDGGAGVDRVSLDVLIGPCWVADATGRGGAVGADDLDALDVPTGTDRLLLRTDNSERWSRPTEPFPESYVSVASDGARWLVDRGMRLVGVDFLGIEARGSGDHATHVTLLSNDVVIVEGLDLRGVRQGAYDLIVMPLRLVDGDGGPARVALRER